MSKSFYENRISSVFFVLSVFRLKLFFFYELKYICLFKKNNLCAAQESKIYFVEIVGKKFLFALNAVCMCVHVLFLKLNRIFWFKIIDVLDWKLDYWNFS